MCAKCNLNLVKIEAYSRPSSSYMTDDSHCFVVTEDRSTCWANHGRGWDEPGIKTKVSENMAYKEWLWEFVPPDNLAKCGLTFSKNGLCHTYANRELLVGESEANASNAAKDYACVFFFGKYGMGLAELKQLLTDSYTKITQTYNDPYNALNKVLARVDNTVDDELRAWRQTAIEHAKIPVDEILNKNYEGGLATARLRMRGFINKRESLYEEYKNASSSEVRKHVKELILAESDDYLNMLARIRYITESERQQYSSNIRTFLNALLKVLSVQQEAFLQTGRIAEDFSALLRQEG